jgi:hypothetical protein
MKRTHVLFALSGIAALSMGSAQAAEICYDFANLTSGQQLQIGQTVTAQHLKVRITDYRRDGIKANPPGGGQFVEYRSSALAGGSSPEIYTYMANMVIEPRQPVVQIRFRVGESHGGAGNPYQGHANILINGKPHEVVGGLAGLDNKELRDDAGGRFLISAQLAQATNDSNWHRGTVKVRALSGRISSFGIGGIPVAVDGMCFTVDAP